MEPRSPDQPHLFLRAGPAFVVLVVLSFAYNWYYLYGGFQLDEYFFLNMLRRDPLPYSRVLGQWSTFDVPGITNLWWFEGGGNAGVFWRPLPSLVFEGSIRVFGERAFPLHLLSNLLHGLVASTLFLLVRRLTGRPGLALLAGIFFLSCEDHSMGVGWISTITDLICVLFVNLSLLAHADWLDKRKPWPLVASLAALVPAFLSKESAVVAPVAIALMTLVMPDGREVELPSFGMSTLWTRVVRFLRDWVSWAPAVALLVAYLAFYRLLGFGGISSGLYIDPLGDPIRYASHLIRHLPVMFLATLSPVPPSLAMFMPETVRPLAVAGAVAFFVWLVGLWPMRRSGLVAWAMSVYMIALLPQLATDASERGLYFPTIGSSILLALLLVQIGPIARRVASTAARAPLATRIVGWAVGLCVLVPGVLLSATMPFMYLPSFEKPYEQVATAFPTIDGREPECVLLLNTPGFVHTFYPPAIIEHHVGRSIDVRVLSSMNGIVSVERVDDQSLILRADRKGWLTNVFASMLRSPKPFNPSKVYQKGFIRATLLEMSSDGRDVLAVRFDLDRPLSDPRILTMRWDGKTFRSIDLAALPIGEVVTLADTSDVWASMW